MKKISIAFTILLIITSCGSGKSFQSFFNDHKRDLGVTAFQVPNFMRTLLTNISPEINNLFGNVRDFKFITFNQIPKEKQAQLISEMNLVTANNFTDILRKNTIEKTKIVSVKEDGNVVTQAIIFNSTLTKTSVIYLKGRFDPNKIKELSDTNQFENLSSKLLQNYQSTPLTPGFNPN
jgi:predicted SnoaL-like aldol condensation-catalyzing enzyme